MTIVKVKCKESRLVAHDKYVVGREYTMDAVRAGKYSECFSGIGRDDDEIIAREWGAIKEKMAADEKQRRVLMSYDPSILAAAAKLVQDQAQKRMLQTAGKEA